MKPKFTEKAQLLRAGKRYDPYSKSYTVDDWKNPIVYEVWDVAVAPTDSTESNADNRVLNVKSDLTLYFVPVNSVVTAGDRVRCRGKVWLVDGAASQYQSPFTGSNPGLVVNLVKEEG